MGDWSREHFHEWKNTTRSAGKILVDSHVDLVFSCGAGLGISSQCLSMPSGPDKTHLKHGVHIAVGVVRDGYPPRLDVIFQEEVPKCTL